MARITNYALFITSLISTLLFSISYTTQDIYGNSVQLALLCFYVLATFVILTTAITHSAKGPRIAMLVFIVQLINILYISFALSFARTLLLIVIAGIGFILASRSVRPIKKQHIPASEPTPTILTSYNVKNKNNRPRITIDQKKKAVKKSTKKKTAKKKAVAKKKTVKRKTAKKKVAKKTVKKSVKKKATKKKVAKKTPYRGRRAKRSL